MAYEFKLPDIGEGVVEGEIVEWLVSEGDTVTEDQPLVAIMTDKATVEIPSPKAGKVTRLGGKAGEVVKVGAVLVTLDAGGGAAAPAEKAKAPEKAAAPREAEKATPEAPAAKGEKAAAAPAKPQPQAATAKPQPAARPEAAAPPARGDAEKREAAPEGSPVLASPATRRLARELGVELSAVEGSGPRGRVVEEDVRAASQSAPSPRPPASGRVPALRADAAPTPLLSIPRRVRAPAEHEEERIPLKGLRKRIAEKMVESKQRIPHFSYVEECDLTELVALRARLKPVAERYGVSLTYLPFIMKALVPCLRAFPLLNASLDDDAGEIVLKKYHNIGVATDTERGLTVPIVRDVEHKSVLEIAAEMAELGERARSSRSKLEDLQDGTFTITSTGNIGGLFATPIINHPEVAILGVPKIRQRPVVRDGQIVIRDIVWLALSLDHRVVDGAVGARFLAMLIEYLEDPGKIFLELA